jgi:hypothetical protein
LPQGSKGRALIKKGGSAAFLHFQTSNMGLAGTNQRKTRILRLPAHF